MSKTTKNAIITGAGSGIGRAISKKLAADGFNVMLVGRNKEKLLAVQKEINQDKEKAIVFTADVSQRKQMIAMAQEAINQWSTIDVLVNNAGIMPLSFLKNLHVDDWENMIDINFKGVLFATAAVLPNMLDNTSGHIINMGSVAGDNILPSYNVYSATKSAVAMLTHSMRTELCRSDNIRCTLIKPGGTKSNLPDSIKDQEVINMIENHRPTFIESEDIANAVAYAINQPKHVDVAEITVIPSAQDRY